MRFYLLFFLIFNLTACGQKKENLDSFSKYSYNISGYKITSDGKHIIPAGGTGFFIKNRGVTFFASAIHVFAGCSNSNTKAPAYPDSLSVIFIDKDSLPTEVFKVRTKEHFTNIPCGLIDTIPDITCFPAFSSPPPDVIEINEVIGDVYKMASELLVFGYPSVSKKSATNEYLYPRPSKIHVEVFDIPPVDRLGFNYFFKTKENIENLDGFSGAPVFIKDKHSGKWSFAGVFTAVSEYNEKEKEMIIVVCKVEQVLEMVEHYPLQK